jgi:hypothetical protein
VLLLLLLLLLPALSASAAITPSHHISDIIEYAGCTLLLMFDKHHGPARSVTRRICRCVAAHNLWLSHMVVCDYVEL